MRSKKRVWLWVVFPVLIVLVTGLWVSRLLQTEKPSLIRTRVVRGDIEQRVRGVGYLEAQEVQSIRGDLAGEIQHLSVQAGQSIHQGDLLYEIKNEDFYKEVRVAKAQYRQARRELQQLLKRPDQTALLESRGALDKARVSAQQLSSDLSEKEELFQKGFVSEKEIKEIKDRLQSAKLEEELASKRFEEVSKPPTKEEIELKRAELSKKKNELEKLKKQGKGRFHVSPSNGLVMEVLKKEGEKVSPEDTVIILIDTLKPFVIEGAVYESDISKINKGQKARARLSGSEKWLEAEVLEISLTAKSSGSVRKFPVKLLIKDVMESPLRLGIGADYEILIHEERAVLKVPVQFVVQAREGYGAWIWVDQRMQFIPLKLGLSDDNFVQILQGLEEGQEVVLPPVEGAH